MQHTHHKNYTLQHPKADSEKRATFCQKFEKKRKKGALLCSLMRVDLPMICPERMVTLIKGSVAMALMTGPPKGRTSCMVFADSETV
jgi:hypothetical protein